MKLKNNRWVDENNNAWSADVETEESAKKKSNSLIRCSRCSDCSDCLNCSYCSGCSDCSSCLYCSDFESNPQRITSDKIGSRNSQTTYYWNGEHEQVVCGCFKGTLNEFEKRAHVVHGDNEHGIAYQKWIDKIRIYKN